MRTTDFTPALGLPGFTRGYDLAIRLLTREAVWRGELLRQVAPRDCETIVWTCNGFVPVTYLIMPPWLRTRAG